MAKILNKDPAIYACERDAFLRELQQFHESRGTPFRRPPLIGSVQIDLYLLYNLVTSRGGWVKLTNKNEWHTLAEHFNLPAQCVNIGVGLKNIYIRYLDRYEKIHYLGEDGERASDEDDESRHKRWSARASHSVPLSYNHQQHNIAESMRTCNGLSAELFKPTDYDRLLLCLLSPLPNEQDFAINTCTLLSNEGKHHLKLEKCPRLIDYLLAHAGVFNHYSMRPVFHHVYNRVRKHPLTSFWSDTLINEQFIDLTDESRFIKRKTVLPVLNTFSKKDRIPPLSSRRELANKNAGVASSSSSYTVSRASSTSSKRGDGHQVVQSNIDESSQNSRVNERLSSDGTSTVDNENVPSCSSNKKLSSSSDDSSDDLFAPSNDDELSSKGDERKSTVKLKIEPGDRELFCVGRTLGTQEYVGQRVLQIANILRNLSFTDDNVSPLANNITFLRFLLLCTNSRWNTLHQYGFDMLSNVAVEVSLKDPIRDRLSECLLLTVTQGLSCDDRFVVISSLDILNKLSHKEANEDVLLRYLEQNVYEQVCVFLTVQDIMLLIYTLECLYALSSLGERACNNISKVRGIYSTLVSLVTVEAQSYGPKACIGMKVVETVPPGTATVSTSVPSSVSTTVTQSIAQSCIQTPVSSLPNSLSCSIASSAVPMSSPSVATPIYTTSTTAIPPNTSSAMAAAVTRVSINNIIPSRNTCTNAFSSCSSTIPQSTVSMSQPQISKPQQSHIQQPQQQSQPQSQPQPQLQPQPQPQPPAPPPQKIQLQPVNHNVQQQHAHQQAIQENEQFALAWLRANFEPDLKGRIEQQELYRNYLNSCSKIGRKGVIAPLHFPRCVRSTFGGTVGPNLSKADNLQYYDGIRMRAQPLMITCHQSILQHQPQQQTAVQQPQKSQQITPVKNPVNRRQSTTKVQNNIQVIQTNVIATSSVSDNTANDIITTPPPSPASPILKAQLSAPFKKEVPTVKIDSTKSQVSAHPHLSQALLGATQVSVASNNVAASNITLTNTANVNLTNMNIVHSCSKESTVVNMPTTSLPPNSIPQNSSSLIKSLLATKVTNDCMTVPMSMKTTSVVTTECPISSASHVASVINTQVTQRQQQQQQQRISQQINIQNVQNVSQQPVIQSIKNSKITKTVEPPNSCRINGAQIKSELSDSIVTSSTHLQINQIECANVSVISPRNNRSTSTAIPPPLAPLSSGLCKHNSKTISRIEPGDDSNSTSNLSLTPNSGIGNNQIGVSEDGDNSLTSFEGLLLNGIPNSLDIDAPCAEENSNVSNVVVKPKTQSLMLADLLEKKIDKKDPPSMNGVLRIGDKGLELVENHIEKALMSKESTFTNTETVESKEVSVIVEMNSDVCNSESMQVDMNSSSIIQSTLKRSAEEPEDVQIKRPHLSSVIVSNTNVNGSTSNSEPASNDTVDSSNGDDGEVGSVSSTAANLYAALAADVLEEEDLEEEIPQPPQPQIQTHPQFATQIVQPGQIINSPPPVPTPPPQQLIVHTGNRQIIVSQPQVITSAGPQMLLTTSGQLIQQAPPTATIKTPHGHQMPVLVQTNQSPNQQRVVFSQMPQSVQFVGAQGNQYVISSANAAGQTTYVMAQPQTAIVQGQTQTVLVAQTTQQGSPAKTIIILQPQNPPHPTHQQKVMVTPQGQQVVMAQVARPVIQTPTICSSASLMSPPQQQQPLQSQALPQQHLPPTQPLPSPQLQPQPQPQQHLHLPLSLPQQPQLPQQPTVITSNACSTNIVKTQTIASVVSCAQSTICINKTTASVGTSTVVTSNSSPVSKMVTCNVKTQTHCVDNKQVRATNTKQTKCSHNIQFTDTIYVCEWKGCLSPRGYKSANEVLLHAVDAHCPTGCEEINCLWERCDNLKRKRFSLMTHLIDRHCNPEAMKVSALRRKQMSQTGRIDHPNSTVPPPPHPGYAPDAALHAIKRHALEFVNPKELMDDNEGPVTKSIRLTASLILRNLVIYSNNSRRHLRQFEPHLANVAMSNVESSRTIAHVLFDLNDNSSPR